MNDLNDKCSRHSLRQLMMFLLMTLLMSASAYQTHSLEPLDNQALEEISGQGGMYLSGEFAINPEGGPLWSTDANTLDEFGGLKQVRNCGTEIEPEECGMRFAVQLEDGVDSFGNITNSWFVVDNLKGGFSFEGLTLRTRYIATDENGDVFDKEVLEVGMPSSIRANNFTYAVAFSDSGEWTPETQQTEIMTIRQNGEFLLQGNLLLFPENNR